MVNKTEHYHKRHVRRWTSNTNVFIKSLKITWLRRIIQNDRNVSWYTLSGIDFHKLFTLGIGYVKNLSQNMQNPFWKDVLQNWAEFCKEFKIESIRQVLDSPLWYNQNAENGNIFLIGIGMKRASNLYRT